MHYSLLFAGSIAACMLFTACAQSGATSHHDKDTIAAGKISWNARPGNAWLLKNSEGECYLYINVRSGPPVDNKQRVPLNISLVLDRSGSMMGEKIAYARQAAKFLIDQLGTNDYLSVVNYDDQVEVTSASQPVKNKEALKHAVDMISDRGATNLSGGMLEGYAQAKHTCRNGYVNRVLLLTDGLANEGIVEPAELKRLVEKKYSEEGIALSTFGLGADYNEDLLTMLAETGRANYYFIDSADKIPQLFAKELKGLLSVVAQNAVVQVSIPGGLQCENVYGYPFEVKDGHVSVRFNDIYANDEKAILIRLKATAPLKASLHFSCNLRYTDAQNFDPVELERQVDMKVTTDKDLVAKGEDAAVQEMLALFKSTEQFDNIMSAVDKGEYGIAKDSARAAITVLKQKQAHFKSPKLEAQAKKMQDYLDNMEKVKTMQEEDRKLFQKSSNSMNYQVKKMKAGQ